MFDKKEHEEKMKEILLAVYADKEIAGKLAFKGGTCCYLFYDLPRFSVDLDFTLLEPVANKLVYDKVHKIVKPLGPIRDKQNKFYSVFFSLSYRQFAQNIKVEISKRPCKSDRTEIKNYMGLPIQVLTQDVMTAHKFVALTTRRLLKQRDIFDCWFFLKNHWPVSEEAILEETSLSYPVYLKKMLEFLEENKNVDMLHGLGELLETKQKSFVKNKLLPELIQLIKIKLS